MGASLPVVNLGAGKLAKSVSCGGFFTCVVLDDDTMKCFGDNQFGLLNGRQRGRREPPRPHRSFRDHHSLRRRLLGATFAIEADVVQFNVARTRSAVSPPNADRARSKSSPLKPAAGTPQPPGSPPTPASGSDHQPPRVAKTPTRARASPLEAQSQSSPPKASPPKAESPGARKPPLYRPKVLLEDGKEAGTEGEFVWG
eukprot:CAMPEP_0180344254 /NCGR_PEP_ID=MMETSP0989-20121125/2718_1 /TAXON_ID=697907 /ORGANISM="non described non described, Strain CCMP2293" /LENGTH=198 /DNA_ID=CAMNT_0022333259 /DNA_START=1 /DNA_END=597 /DNA_ORIENTATION=+